MTYLGVLILWSVGAVVWGTSMYLGHRLAIWLLHVMEAREKRAAERDAIPIRSGCRDVRDRMIDLQDDPRKQAAMERVRPHVKAAIAEWLATPKDEAQEVVR